MTSTQLSRARRSATAEALASTCLLTLATVQFGMLTSGRFTNYLQAWFKPYLLVATVAMIALAIWTLLTASDTLDDATSQSAEDDAPTDDAPASDSHTHNHGHATPRVSVLLLVPALVFAIAAPAALGTDAAAKQAPVDPKRIVGAEPVDFDPLPDHGITELTVQDYADRYYWGRPEELGDKQVRMLGFVGEGKNPDGQGWSVNRFRIYCCAADANLFSVDISGVDKPEGENVWVQVEGFYDAPASNEVPTLKATSLQIVPEPEEPYL